MTQFFVIIAQMAPYLLLGFMFAGLLHAFIPTQFYGKYLSKEISAQCFMPPFSAFRCPCAPAE